MKICERNSASSQREVSVYRHLDTVSSHNPGALMIRELYDSFDFKGRHGEYSCLIHEPLGVSIETLRGLVPSGQLPEDLLRAVLRHLLQALDCLHTDAHTVHTGKLVTVIKSCGLLIFSPDLQARNIHLRVDDESVWKDFEEQELTDPSARKWDGDCVIYESRGLRMTRNQGRLVLCDFGEARFGSGSYTDDIQPYVYRAPEVMLDIPWSYPADIWNVGVMVWDLFKNKHLFNARGPSGEQRIEFHLAEMVAILGPPPADFLQRSETCLKYFGPDGRWKAEAAIPQMSLKSLEVSLQGQNKTLFLAFMRKMLQWAPEDRQTAHQLLEDPWLNGMGQG